VERALTGRLTNNTVPPTTAPISADGTLKLDPQLQQALLQQLRLPAQSGSRTPWIILLVVGIIAAGALITWVAVHKPEASPLSVAVTIFGTVTAFVVKLAAQEPTLPSGEFPAWVVAVSATSTVAGALLIVLAIVRLSAREGHQHPMGAMATPEEERKEKNRQSLLAISLVVYGLSAILIALVPAMVFHSEEITPDKKPPQATVMSSVSVSKLSPISNLGDGGKPSDKIIDPNRILTLTKDATTHKTRAGDILLLLGSADCRPTKSKARGGLWNNNEELADARANWVKKGLNGQLELSGVRVEARPLPQHSGCRETPDVRAVYPFLIQAKQGQPSAQP
jgi:flagellar basal body-associated protein FliL